MLAAAGSRAPGEGLPQQGPARAAALHCQDWSAPNWQGSARGLGSHKACTSPQWDAVWLLRRAAAQRCSHDQKGRGSTKFATRATLNAEWDGGRSDQSVANHCEHAIKTHHKQLLQQIACHSAKHLVEVTVLCICMVKRQASLAAVQFSCLSPTMPPML